MKHFSKIINIVLGFVFLLYIIYFRLFRDSSVRSLSKNLWESQNYILLFIYIVIFSTFIYTLFINLITLANPHKFSKSFGFFKKIGKWYFECLGLFFDFLTRIFYEEGAGRPFIEKMGLFLFNFCNTRVKLASIIAIVFIIPRFLFLFIFFYDIFILHQFGYVIKFSFLLLIPLLGFGLQMLLETFCETNMKILGDIFIIIDAKTQKRYTPKEYLDQLSYVKAKTENILFKFVPTYFHNATLESQASNRIWDPKQTIQKFVLWYQTILAPINSFMRIFSLNKEYINKYFYIFYDFCFSILWGYIIYYVF